MIALKNSSQNSVRYNFSGNEFNFLPGEIKLLDQDVVDHLLRVSMTCAVGGSPLKVITADKVPAELLAAPESSPNLRLVRNTSEIQVSVMFAGRAYDVPAKGEAAFPADVACHLVEKRVNENRHDLCLVEGKEPVVEPVAPESLVPAVEPKAEEKKENKKWRKFK